MKTSIVSYTCVVSLGLFSANIVQAQFLRGLGDRLVDSVANRVERNVENRIVQSLEERAGQAVDQSFDAMFTGVGNNEAGGDAAGRTTFSKLLDTSNILTLDEYRFDIAATFEIQTLDRRGRVKRDEAAEMVFYYSANAPYTGTRMTSGAGASEGSAMIIYDFDNNLMLMLMESEGERFAMPYNWGAIMEDMDNSWTDDSWTDESIDEAFPDFERLGSRKIAGYQSEGFRTSNESHVTEIWVSNEVAPGIERIFQANRAMPMLGGNLPSGYPQGMLMELNAEDLETGESVVMRTRSIETDADISYKMQDYPLLNLGMPTQP